MRVKWNKLIKKKCIFYNIGEFKLGDGIISFILFRYRNWGIEC